MSDAEEVKRRTDIVDLIGSYVQLQKAGRNYKALCPFHTEKTPSFVVFPESQRWHCFGACSIGGDVFNFVMKHENVEFPEALRMLAERAGVPLTPLDANAQRAREERVRLHGANASAAQEYHALLLESAMGEPARRYLERRGVSRETMATFQLGYAPNEWHWLEARLSRAHRLEDLITAGLVVRGERGTTYDRFRGRVMFPIRDVEGHVIGFGGRVLDDSVPKYLNSPETPLFSKGNVLYGIDLAQKSIRESGTAVIVEGYMDVIIPYQCGATNLVACLGTALTEFHISTLKRYTKLLVLALDPDAAGLQATERGIETARESLDRKVVPTVTPTGLIRYERHLETEIRVMPLPDGLDPDELILQDRAKWDQLVSNALPVADFYFQMVLEEEDIEGGRGKRNASDRLLPVIAAMDGAAERAHYVQRLARHLRVDERELLREVTQMRETPVSQTARGQGRRRGRKAQRAARAGRESADVGGGLEEHLVALLYATPTLLSDTGEVVTLSEDSFRDVMSRQAYSALKRWQSAPIDERPVDPIQALDAHLRAHVESALRVLRDGPPLSLESSREDFLKCAIRLRLTFLSRSLNELRFVLEDAQEEGDQDRVREINARIERLTKDYLEIHRQSYAVSLVGRGRQGQGIS